MLFLVAGDVESVKQLKARTIKKLKGRYAAVVDKLRLIIDSQKLDITSLILKLRSLDENKTTIFSTNEVFEEIHSTTELFLHIGKYCSFYDYELLETFVESTECEEAIKLLEDFTKELHHSILIDLSLLSKDGELRDPQDFMPGTHKLVIKYVGDKCTLKTKEIVQNIIYECFRLTRGSIIFKGVTEGCVAFVYQISPTVKSYLLQYPLTTKDTELLFENQINCVIVDDKELKLPKVASKILCASIVCRSMYVVDLCMYACSFILCT